MGLLDGFEKLINEHGSAAILKERIALANDKYSALEQKFMASESRAEVAELRAKNLESENEALRLDNNKIKSQARNLEEQLKKFDHDQHLFFDGKTGTWAEKNGTLRYCPKCKATNTLSPMRNEADGWFCPVCSVFTSNPDRRPNTPINME